MTNWEKYKDEILAADQEYRFGEWCNEHIEGYNSLHNTPVRSKIFIDWCNEEYKEPEIDWTKVEVDTPILVRDFSYDMWVRQHFAKYVNGCVYAWDEGATSFTAKNCWSWRYAKLYKEGEE